MLSPGMFLNLNRHSGQVYRRWNFDAQPASGKCKYWKYSWHFKEVNDGIKQLEIFEETHKRTDKDRSSNFLHYPRANICSICSPRYKQITSNLWRVKKRDIQFRYVYSISFNRFIFLLIKAVFIRKYMILRTKRGTNIPTFGLKIAKKLIFHISGHFFTRKMGIFWNEQKLKNPSL